MDKRVALISGGKIKSWKDLFSVKESSEQSEKEEKVVLNVDMYYNKTNDAKRLI